jgi:hypothetical protein
MGEYSFVYSGSLDTLYNWEPVPPTTLSFPLPDGDDNIVGSYEYMGIMYLNAYNVTGGAPHGRELGRKRRDLQRPFDGQRSTE